MKQFICLCFVVGMCFLSGCFTPTQSTVEFYDTNNQLTKKLITSESLAKTMMNGMKDHTVIRYDNGWKCYGRATMTTGENPLPCVEFGAGKADKATLFIHKDHDINVVPQLITKIRDSEIKFTIKDSSASILSGSTEDELATIAKQNGVDPKNLDHKLFAWTKDNTIIYTYKEKPVFGDIVLESTFFSSKLKVAKDTVMKVGEESILVGNDLYLRTPKSDKEPNVDTTSAVSNVPAVNDPASPVEATKAATSSTTSTPVSADAEVQKAIKEASK